MVDVAPYGGVFPLTAIINKANHNVQDVKVTVLGKGEKVSRSVMMSARRL